MPDKECILISGAGPVGMITGVHLATLANATQPMLDVKRIGILAHFAVADDVNPGRHLFGDDVTDDLSQEALERRIVIVVAFELL